MCEVLYRIRNLKYTRGLLWEIVVWQWSVTTTATPPHLRVFPAIRNGFHILCKTSHTIEEYHTSV